MQGILDLYAANLGIRFQIMMPLIFLYPFICLRNGLLSIQLKIDVAGNGLVIHFDHAFNIRVALIRQKAGVIYVHQFPLREHSIFFSF